MKLGYNTLRPFSDSFFFFLKNVSSFSFVLVFFCSSNITKGKLTIQTVCTIILESLQQREMKRIKHPKRCPELDFPPHLWPLKGAQGKQTFESTCVLLVKTCCEIWRSEKTNGLSAEFMYEIRSKVFLTFSTKTVRTIMNSVSNRQYKKVKDYDVLGLSELWFWMYCIDSKESTELSRQPW